MVSNSAINAASEANVSRREKAGAKAKLIQDAVATSTPKIGGNSNALISEPAGSPPATKNVAWGYTANTTA
jgi:hypothetical protein